MKEEENLFLKKKQKRRGKQVCCQRGLGVGSIQRIGQEMFRQNVEGTLYTVHLF